MKTQRTRQTEVPIQTEENARYTSEQWQAIHLEGDNLLVSASAGSGKTSVLVQRILQKIRRGYGVDELLVVTFTEKAASEMKERLEQSLQEMINQEFDPESRQHYLQQIAKLPQANISTIDAFCKQVIQRYYFLIDLDPVYRLLTDATENAMHLESVWEKLKEKMLAEKDEHYLLIAKHFASDRKDDEIDQLIFELYNKSRVHTDPNGWLDGLLKNYPDADTAYGESEFYQNQVAPTIQEELDALIKNSQIYLKDLPVGEAVGFQKMADAVLLQIQFFEKLKLAVASSYKEAYQITISEKFPPLPRKTKKDFDPENDAQSSLRDDLKKRHKSSIQDVYEKNIETYFAFDEHYQGQFIQEAKALSEAIIKVEKIFSQQMLAHKFEQRILDFSDIELFTYQILTKVVAGQTDKAEMNEAKAYYRDKFEEVMIDEYQDVNALQEAILQAVSGNPEDPNMFMVGDVKQSIYRFRFAEPGLFIHKFNAFASGNGGQRIILAENFRSRSDVLDFTNFIFEQVMDPEVGQIAYDEDAALKLGFTAYPDTDRMHTEILLYDQKDDDQVESSEDDLLEESPLEKNSEKMQAELIAQSIKQKIDNNHLIYDKKLGADRPITYDDIVILVATRKNHGELEETFAQYKIPILLDDAANYFQRTEIRTMLNMLKFIDNPYQDIPLAAILRSPIIGLNEQELAKIRIANQEGTYYDALKSYLRKYPDGRMGDKLAQLNQWHQNWRMLARDKPLATLIWQIYTDTGYLDYVAGMPNGHIRQNNLHGFYKIATDYESSAFRGIFQFIRFVEKIQEKDNDLQAPKSGGDAENAVHVYTIHHSKGLEFPLVYFFNASKQFNTQDLKSPVVYNDEVGIGVKLNDQSRHITYPNMFHTMAKYNEKKDMLAEEMRKLYVALTRAEQQLVIVGTVKDMDKTIEKWQTLLMNDKLLSKNGRIKAMSLLDWMGPSLMRHHDFDPVNQIVHIDHYLTDTDARFKLNVTYQQDIMSERNKWVKDMGQASDKDGQDLITALLNQEQTSQNHLHRIELPVSELDYAYQSATKTTSYQSVSELKRMLQDPDERDLQPWSTDNKNRLTQTFRYTEDDFEQPRFIQKDQILTPMVIGSAAHLLMQKISLENKPTKEDFKKLFDYLAEKNILAQELWQYIQVDKLVDFFETSAGQLLLKNQAKLYREETFSLAIAGSEIFTDMTTDDDLLVHGTIDGFILLEDEIILYDFKTDRIAYLSDQQQGELLISRYEKQMDLYATALETIWHKPVKQKLIISLDTLKSFFV